MATSRAAGQTYLTFIHMMMIKDKPRTAQHINPNRFICKKIQIRKTKKQRETLKG